MGGGDEKNATAVVVVVVRASADPHPDSGGDAHAITKNDASATTTTTTTRRVALLSTAAASVPLASSSLMRDVVTATTATARVAFSTAGMTAASALAQPRAASAATRPLAVVRSKPVTASAGEIFLSIALPPGYHLTKGANSRYEVEVVGDRDVDHENGRGKAAPSPLKVEPAAGMLVDGQDVRLKFSAAAGGDGHGGGRGSELRANCTVYFCREDDICLLQRVRFEVPVVPVPDLEGGRVGGAGGAAAAAALRFEVPAADMPASQPANSVAASPGPIPSLDDL